MNERRPPDRIRLKYLADIEMGQSPPSDEYHDDPEMGIPFLQGSAEFGKKCPDPKIYCSAPTKVANEGDLLFSVRAPVGEMNIADQAYGIGRGLCAVQPGSSLLPSYAWYALMEARDTLKLVSTGSTYEAVATEDVANLRICSYPIAQQSSLADFLDEETSAIDTLIDAKQRLLVLLGEKRRAVVYGAVLRGLDASVSLRPSGIEWLGDIPRHWEVERARWLFSELDERSPTGEEEMLTVSHLTGVTPRSEKDVNMFEAESTVGYKLCFAGDLVINTLWAWMGAMGTARVDGIVSPAYNVYTPCSRLLPAYVDALVRTPVFAQEVTRYSKGVWSSRLRLYPEGFFETYWPVPPIDEQVKIAEHVKAEATKVERLQKATEHSIRLLKERRAALIAAAVSGRIDVPEAA